MVFRIAMLPFVGHKKMFYLILYNKTTRIIRGYFSCNANHFPDSNVSNPDPLIYDRIRIFIPSSLEPDQLKGASIDDILNLEGVVEI